MPDLKAPPVPTPAQRLAIRRHLNSAEGAHLLCRRKACRRARACRQNDQCRSALYGAAGAGPANDELMALRLAYVLSLADHWARLPAHRAPGAAAGGRPPRSRNC
jgi:hypothetical protein